MREHPRAGGDDTCWPATLPTIPREKNQSVVVDRITAIMAGGTNGPALLVLGGFDHDGLAVADPLGENSPHVVTDPGARVPDEDPGGDLDHPPREVTTQALGRSDEDDDGH